MCLTRSIVNIKAFIAWVQSNRNPWSEQVISHGEFNIVYSVVAKACMVYLGCVATKFWHS